MLLLMGLFGCFEGATCTTEIVPSIHLELFDQDGQPVDGLVHVAWDGGTSDAVEAVEEGVYSIGEDVPGDYEIWITVEIPTSADCYDYGTANLQVTVEEDECHVITQSLVPELEWENVCSEPTE